MAVQRNYFSILFFIKKTKLLKTGEAPIGLRITVNGKSYWIKRKFPFRNLYKPQNIIFPLKKSE